MKIGKIERMGVVDPMGTVKGLMEDMIGAQELMDKSASF